MIKTKVDKKFICFSDIGLSISFVTYLILFEAVKKSYGK